VTNCGVLAVLVQARRQFGSSVHTLITNQCAMDLFSSVTLMGTMAMLVTHGYHNNNHNNNNNNNISFRIPTPRRTGVRWPCGAAPW